MKALILIAALLAGPSLVQAANINQGNVEIGGVATVNHTRSRSLGTTSFQIGANAQYFLVDHISVGAELDYAHASSFNIYSIAPAASFYFAVQDQMAPYVMVKPLELYDSSSARLNLSSGLRLGVKFFLTDSVAFGPALNYEHTWSTNRTSTIDSFSLLGQFAIHL